jgi:two-component system, OmpR family, phosphate regulon sensor histidine kinase PhoR
MREPKLIWQLFIINIIILLGAMLAVAWYGTYSLKNFYVNQMTNNLKTQSDLIKPQIEQLIIQENFHTLKDYCFQARERVATRITVVNRQGNVLCESEHVPSTMENHADRPEIIKAFEGEAGVSQRYSMTTRQDRLYVAIPIKNESEIIGALRTSIPLTAIDDKLRDLFARLALSIIGVTVLAGTITLFVARKITRPLEHMKRQSLRYAAGDFTQKISVTGSEEIVSLAQAMNKMAVQLDERMKAVLGKRNELETVLAGMVEGVIAVDPEDRVLYMNKSARMQLGIEQRNIQGNSLLEIVRNLDLLRFIQQTILKDEPSEKTIILNQDKSDEKILQVHGAQLFDAQKTRLGALVVINDVTKLLRLESLRRDFVANVSHELKTPITSIKGYVETLLDEAGELPRHVQDFLTVISKQTNRLQAIVEDLLSLAKIEKENDRDEILLEYDSIREVLQNAVEACSAKAAERNIQVTLQGGEQIYIFINGPLLEQAVINLLDNAIKYSKAGGAVLVETTEDDDEFRISIKDSGIGIEQQYLERLFERFYVVDKGRSREFGGTGLGLAIVKHIVQAHGGRVTVKSKMNQGSIFTIHLPKNNDQSIGL